jgi:hypothetical protein
MKFDEFDCLLRALQSLSLSQRRAFFHLATNSQLRAFEEACYNLIKNKNTTSKRLYLLTQKSGPTIKVLSRKAYPLELKRKLLIQKGGFLASLSPVIATVVTNLIAAHA